MKLLLLVLLVVSCSRLPVQTPVETTPSEPDVETEIAQPIPTQPTQTPNTNHIGEGAEYTQTPVPVPNVQDKFTVKINSKYCSDEQVEKLKKSEEVITKIVRSSQFKDKMINHVFDGKKQFNWNENMSNEQIYKHLVKGAEALLPAENHQMDIEVECYYNKWTSTIGYTYPKTLTVYVNMKFHQYYSVCEVVGNVFHEWTHKMGFDHAASWSKPRDFTVPYASGYLVEEMCKTI